MQHYAIRRAEAGDAADLANLANALARAQGYEGGAMTAERVVDDLLSGNRGLDVHVAEVAGAVIGYVLHHIAYESAHAARGRYVSDLYVVPSARRRGIATALLKEAARITAEEGGVFLWWVSKGKDEAARALYGRLANATLPITAHAAIEGGFSLLAGSTDGAAEPER